MIDTHIIKKYQQGASLASLSKETGISTYQLRKFLVAQGVKIRSRNEQNKYNPQNQRKYTINDNFFSEQNSQMAYLLGFFAADGCVYQNDNGIKLTLASVDRPFLEMVNKLLDSTYPIKDYETKEGYKNSELRFTSSQIKKDFAEYNIVPRKTYCFTFPQKLKKEYYRDFIRGYFDGDGSISRAGKSAIRWQVCSHEKDVLEKIVNFFEEYDIPRVDIQKYMEKEVYYIQYSSVPTRKIFDILYYDNCLCLSRKLEKYKSLMI